MRRVLTSLISRKRAQRDKVILQEYRAYYFNNRPTWEVERQEEEEYVEPTVDLHILAQLAEILCHQPEDWSSELLKFRIQAAELMVTLCIKRR
jgi:hypothetical protein